ncbi:MAG: hypothetical protein F9K27_07705 [Anaerolineae bacterium]|nr:MAG: hypothetical protein F9K27_07705 [Anaerolineae bacterium]
MRLSSVIFMVLEAYLLAFLTLKTYVVLTAVPGLPNTILEIFLNCVSFYIHLNLLLRRLWAWWVVFALNVMGLALAFSLLISRGEPFPWGMVLESAFMLVLLYANRHMYLKPLRSRPFAISTSSRKTLEPHYGGFGPSHTLKSSEVNHPLHNGNQPDNEEMPT